MGATWVLQGLRPLLPIPLPNSFCKACCSLFLCLLFAWPSLLRSLKKSLWIFLPIKEGLGQRFYWNQTCTWLGLMWSLIIVVMPLSLGFMLHFLTHCFWRHCHVFQRNGNPNESNGVQRHYRVATLWYYDVPVNELLICTKLQWFMLFTKVPILFTRISPMDYGGPIFPRMFSIGSKSITTICTCS